MIELELYWVFALNIILNSFLTFVTFAGLIYTLLFVFRIKHPRFRTILLSLPLLKLVIDPFYYNFESWALTHQVNPFLADTGTRMFSISLCYPNGDSFFPLFTAIELLVNEYTFTLADLLFLSVSKDILKGIIIVVATITIVAFIGYITHLWHCIKSLSKQIQKANFCLREIQNLALIQQIKKYKVNVIISSTIRGPCAFSFFGKYICFPLCLVEKLSQEEFEAIIAHELQHLYWHDGLLQTFLNCIAAIFWWIPTKALLKSAECNLEKDCDYAVKRFGFSSIDLASAILKAIKYKQIRTHSQLLCNFLYAQTITERVQFLLEDTNRKHVTLYWIQIVVVSFIALCFFWGKFWIF